MALYRRIYIVIFEDNFESCKEKMFNEADFDFKTYSDLTQHQLQIKLLPSTKRNIKAFVQWKRDDIRLGLNPLTAGFSVEDTYNLIWHFKTHAIFYERSKNISKAAKPVKFTKETKCIVWEPSFMSYICAITERCDVTIV